jgi:hypothetical protein
MNRLAMALGATLLATMALAQDRAPLFADYQHMFFDPPLHSKKITITVD